MNRVRTCSLSGYTQGYVSGACYPRAAIETYRAAQPVEEGYVFILRALKRVH